MTDSLGRVPSVENELIHEEPACIFRPLILACSSRIGLQILDDSFVRQRYSTSESSDRSAFSPWAA